MIEHQINTVAMLETTKCERNKRKNVQFILFSSNAALLHRAEIFIVMLVYTCNFFLWVLLRFSPSDGCEGVNRWGIITDLKPQLDNASNMHKWANGGHIGLFTINLHSYNWHRRRGFYSFRLSVGMVKLCVNNFFSQMQQFASSH